MKRQAIDLDTLASRDNLALALWKAARGKRQRAPVARFLEHADERLAQLGRRIRSGEAPLGQAKRFVIEDPKRRVITAACFEDRVLHHAILNLAEPRFERALADSVYACRVGKGVHAAVAAVQRGLQRWPWVVQVDVAGYFPSIDHAQLSEQLARLFKGRDFLDLLARIVAAGSAEPGRGLPIGSLTSQHFANHYLATADRLLLEHAGVGAHVRYMDDIVWFCDSHAAAAASLDSLDRHVQFELGLRLKPRRILHRSHLGLAFCGFRARQGVLLAGQRKMSRARQHKRRLDRAELLGAPIDDLQRAHAASAGAMLPAQTLEFRRRLWWPDEGLL